MNIHIHYHSILVLLATVYPVSVPQIMLSFFKRYNSKSQNVIYLMNCVIISALLLLFSFILMPVSHNIVTASKTTWYIIGIATAPLLIAVEFIVGGVMLKASKIKIKGISVNSNWTKISGIGAFLTILYAITEEFIFRHLWSVVILDNLGWDIIVFIILSSVVYGFNHLYYGFTTFLQKTVSGIFLAVIFLLSGRNIIISITAHSLQNIIILIMGRYRLGE